MHEAIISGGVLCLLKSLEQVGIQCRQDQRETALVSGFVSLGECLLLIARQFPRIGIPDIASLDGLVVRKVSYGF